MGCAGSHDYEEDDPAPPTRGYQPHEPIDMAAILGKSSTATPVQDAIPEGFPKSPEKAVFEEGMSEDQYKEYMRQKMKYEVWENGLALYRIKMSNGDTEGCEKIIERLRDQL